MLAVERPPRWGLIAIVVLVVANVGLVMLLVQRGNAPAPQAASATARTTASPAEMTAVAAPASPTGPMSANPSDDAEPPLLAVYGDGYSSTPAQVQAAAAQTFQAIRAAAPDTRLLVIGPSWSSAGAPAGLTAVSAAVQQAAQAAGATYADPLAQDWFADPTGLVSPADDISILDAGHAYLAGLIAPLVRTALAG